MKIKIILIIIGVALLVGVFYWFQPSQVLAFVTSDEFSYDHPGFFSGIWHGSLAPYSLIARWFIDDIKMYAIPNSGWFYDLGYLMGIAVSLPIGWLGAIVSFLGHLF
jgi:hypothetical protein